MLRRKHTTQRLFPFGNSEVREPNLEHNSTHVSLTCPYRERTTGLQGRYQAAQAKRWNHPPETGQSPSPGGVSAPLGFGAERQHALAAARTPHDDSARPAVTLGTNTLPPAKPGRQPPPASRGGGDPLRAPLSVRPPDSLRTSARSASSADRPPGPRKAPPRPRAGPELPAPLRHPQAPPRQPRGWLTGRRYRLTPGPRAPRPAKGARVGGGGRGAAASPLRRRAGGAGARGHPRPDTWLTRRPPRDRSSFTPLPRAISPAPPHPISPAPPTRLLSPAPARLPVLLPPPLFPSRAGPVPPRPESAPLPGNAFTTSRDRGGSATMFGAAAAAEEDDADFLSPASGWAAGGAQPGHPSLPFPAAVRGRWPVRAVGQLPRWNPFAVRVGSRAGGAAAPTLRPPSAARGWASLLPGPVSGGRARGLRGAVLPWLDLAPGLCRLRWGRRGSPAPPGRGWLSVRAPQCAGGAGGGQASGSLGRAGGAPGPEPARLPADPGWVFSVSPSRRSGSSRSRLVMEGTGERNRGFHLNKGVSGRS